MNIIKFILNPPVSFRTLRDCVMYDCFFPISSCYDVDLWLPEGWHRLDNAGQAPYYGVWYNDEEYRLLTYCEGDWTLQECGKHDNYMDEKNRAIEFCKHY